MGNSPSAARPRPCTSPDSKIPSSSIASKRSLVFSALTLGCASDAAYSDYNPSQLSTLVEHESKHNLEQPPPVYTSTPDLVEDDKGNAAFKAFLKEYPEYHLTWTLDALRRSDFSRLDRSGETYVDYMGGSLYPDSLIRVHTSFLQQNVLGNTHSVNNSSRLSATHAAAARQAVLSFFGASPDEYTVVFTANASGALKLVGEAFPFADGGRYILAADSHNSVHGIRQYATRRGAEVHYIECAAQGGVDINDAMNVLSRHHHPDHSSPSLFALTAQSNVTNTKNSLSLIKHAASLGYSTLLDAAALAPTSVMSLADTPVDAMAISFYKMFGFPTGVGALIARKDFLAQLERPWFAGGTVDVVQAPGTIHTMATEIHERFEDGTINYLSLPAITDGLRFLSGYLPFLPLRLSILSHYLIYSLLELRHERTGTPVARILSRIPSRRLKSVGEQSDTGSLVSLLFLDPDGNVLPLSFIEHSAAVQNISLRTGCMCNPGGASALLELREDMGILYPGVTKKALDDHVGHEVGVVRISLGLASNFKDVFRVLRFAGALSRETDLGAMYTAWLESKATTVTSH